MFLLAVNCRLAHRSGSQFCRHSSTFKRAFLEKFQKPLTIQEVKEEKLNDGEARIKVHCCSINPSDVLLTQGVNPAKFSVPVVPGYEFTGIVTEVKKCKDVAKGDRVVALSKDKLGGFAGECVVNEKDIWLLPSNVSFEEGAALVDSFGTALLGLSHRAQLKEKQIVLITFAPVHGYAALDIAAHVFKAKVIAVCMNEEDTEKLRERGAWSTMAYSESQMMAVVSKLTKKQGVDVVYDTLAGEVLKSCLKCVRHEGNIIIAGYTLKELPQVSISEMLSLPSFSITGVSLTSYRKHNFQMYRQVVSDVLEMKEQGLITPMISSKFSLAKINEAFEEIKQNNLLGKY
uniref:Putative nadph:quinone reductase and related zn-dependent oxidoreductase n=1 Tax=Rhodnius prolixus TaxID=13249 RepID=R4G3K5_RHOPR